MTPRRTTYFDIVLSNLTTVTTVLLRALFLMFFFAVVDKQFGVLAPVGYPEAVAWALGYGLLRGLFHKDEGPK